MSRLKTIGGYWTIFLVLLAACKTMKPSTPVEPSYVYKAESKELYDTIIRLDSIYWNAYNTCDMKTQEIMYSDSLEFFHDRGGVTTSKQEVLNAIRNNICGKVTRQAVPGSIEIYPIKNFGAVEMGLHKFYNNQEPNAESRPGRFIIVWQHKDNAWKMKRVISLH